MQWHYNNTGNVYAQTSSWAPTPTYTPPGSSTGNPDVTVAAVDQGVKYDHEDLAANMWVNEAERTARRASTTTATAMWTTFTATTSPKRPANWISAELMHGTHAGTIAAVNNNGVGVAASPAARAGRRREDHVV